MQEPFIFISCGQSTDSEKMLGKKIAQRTAELTICDAYFAENAHDLNGLHANILGALNRCSGIITVIHPRGTIQESSGIVRASVWIEQEIAIATYIQLIEKRTIPVIAFIHSSVCLEGIRQLIHLNPIRFTHDSEILNQLDDLLLGTKWAFKSHPPDDVSVQLKNMNGRVREGHIERSIVVSIHNNSNRRIEKYDGELHVPSVLLAHDSGYYPSEIKDNSADRTYRKFSLIQPSVPPRRTQEIFKISYCKECAIEKKAGRGDLIAATLVDELEIRAIVWANDREYSTTKTVRQLLQSEAFAV